jgi:BMFP domain-containing protein YqiC
METAETYRPHHPRRVYVEERLDALEERLARLEERLNAPLTKPARVPK